MEVDDQVLRGIALAALIAFGLVVYYAGKCIDDWRDGGGE